LNDLRSRVEREQSIKQEKRSLKEVYTHVMKHLIENPDKLLQLKNKFQPRD